MQQLSATGLALIKQSEGFRAATYKDIAGFPTIGYGHRIVPPESYPNGMTEAQASAALNADVFCAERTVARLVRVPLTQGQFDALVDFCFNMGGGRLAASTLLRDLNAGQYDAAALQLLSWDHGMVAGHEVEVAALKARRLAEYELFTGHAYTAAKPIIGPPAAKPAPATAATK